MPVSNPMGMTSAEYSQSGESAEQGGGIQVTRISSSHTMELFY